MPSNLVNKVQFGNETLIDLTSDTVAPKTLLKGETAHNRSGEQITGTGIVGEWSSEATLDSNLQVSFDNLDPLLDFELHFEYNSTGELPDVYYSVAKSAGTTTGTIKLTYTVTGLSSGNKCRLFMKDGL